MPKPIHKLVVISSAVHYDYEGRLYGYGPYVREIDILADLFSEIVIAAPCRRAAPAGDSLPFGRSNISIAPQPETGGGLAAKLLQIGALPLLVLGLCRAMRGAGAIQVRCPGNLGLLGTLLAPLFSRFLVVKYAGQWNGYAREPWSVRLQRRILRSWWWRNGLVTVYGEWPNQPRHIIPFFTSMMTAEQVRRASAAAARKRLSYPVQLLFAGRLSRNKSVDILLRALHATCRRDWQLKIAGDGPMRADLESLAASLGIVERVHFLGAVPYEDVMRCYEQSHVFVLPSYTEGWPKVLTEAMCHGLACVGTTGGLVPWLLEGRGYTFPAGDPVALSAILLSIFDHPGEYERRSRAGAEWARQYSLESLRDALDQLFRTHWPAYRPTTDRDTSYRAAVLPGRDRQGAVL